MLVREDKTVDSAIESTLTVGAVVVVAVIRASVLTAELMLMLFTAALEVEMVVAIVSRTRHGSDDDC